MILKRLNKSLVLLVLGLGILSACTPESEDEIIDNTQIDVEESSNNKIEAVDSDGNTYEYEGEYFGAEMTVEYIENIGEEIKRIRIGHLYTQEGIAFTIPYALGTYKMGTEYDNGLAYAGIVDMLVYQETADSYEWYQSYPEFEDDESIDGYEIPTVTITKIDEQIIEGRFQGTIIMSDQGGVGDYITFASGSFKISQVSNFQSGLDQYSQSIATWPYGGGGGSGGGGGGSNPNIDAHFVFGTQSSFITPGYPDMYLDTCRIKFENQSTGDVVSYYWDFDDGNTSEEENPENLYDLYNLYNDMNFDVTLHVFDAQGNEDTHTESIELTMLRPIGKLVMNGEVYEFGFGEGNALSNYFTWAQVNQTEWLKLNLTDYYSQFSSRDIILNMSSEPDVYNLFQQSGSIIPDPQGSYIGFYLKFRGFETYFGGASSGFMKKSARPDVYELIDLEMQLRYYNNPDSIVNATINIVNLPHKDVF